MLENSLPPSEAVDQLEKPVLAFQLLHQNSQSILIKSHLDLGLNSCIYIRVKFYYQDDVRAEILKEFEE